MIFFTLIKMGFSHTCVHFELHIQVSPKWYVFQVYGLTEAVVSVGYEHHDCDSIIWHHSTVTLKGYDVDISNIGGWNLDIHHHYNPNEGIYN